MILSCKNYDINNVFNELMRSITQNLRF